MKGCSRSAASTANVWDSKMIKNVVGMYFSPSGATAKITKKITIELTDNMRDSCLDDLSYSFYDMLCLSERHGINYIDWLYWRDYRRDGTSCYVWTHSRDLQGDAF